jgi:hypothetical protein
MAVTLNVTRSTVIQTDVDGDTVADPGDTLRTTVTITNSGTDAATGVTLTDALNGSTQTGTVTVTPIAFNDAYSLNGNTPITISAALGVLANDIDPNASTPLSNTGLTAISVDTTGTNGSVSLNADGSFTFTPTTGFVGVTSFQYTAHDAEGLNSNVTGTVTLTVTGLTWYVDSAYGGGNGAADGSYMRPFTSLASLNGAANNGASTGDVDGSGDTIFVYNRGTAYGSGINLEASQTLIGDGEALTVNGIAIGASGANATINHSGIGVGLASGNTVRGLDLVGTATGATGIADLGGTVGTATVSNVGISGQGATVYIDQGGTLAMSLNSIASTGSSVGGLVLGSVQGSVTVSGTTSLSGSFGQTAFSIYSSSGDLDVALQGNVVINSGSVTAISMVGNASGSSLTLSGASKDIDTATATAVSFNGAGTSLNFTNGGLDLDSGSSTALNATIGGTVTITGSGNAISSTSGTAVNLTNVASGGITLERVDSGAGSTAGVILDNAGTGGFTVTGVGATAGTGGTIGAKSGADGATTSGVGVYLNNTGNISLTDMNFSGTTQNYAILGNNVSNFTLRDSNTSGVIGTSTAQDEAAIRFNGLTGTALFEGNNLQGGFENILSIINTSGTLNVTVRDSANHAAIIGKNDEDSDGIGAGSDVANGNDGIFIENVTTGSITATIDGVTFQGARGDMVQIVAGGTVTQNIAITNNTFHNTHNDVVSGGGGIAIGGGGGSAANYTVNYDISGNSLRGAEGTALFVGYAGGAGTIRGTILNNIIGVDDNVYSGTQATTGSNAGGAGIAVYLDKTGGGAGTITQTVRIEGNQIRDVLNGLGAIFVHSNGDGITASARLEATIRSNVIEELGTSNGGVYAGIYAQLGGNGDGDRAVMGLDISNNTVTLAGTPGGNAYAFDQLSDDARYYLPGYGGSANGEYPLSGSAGTASTGISNYLLGKGNSGVNGNFPTTSGRIADASIVVGVGGGALTQPVPLTAVAAEGHSWDEAVSPPPADTGTGQPDADNEDTTPADGAPAPAAGGVLDQAALDVLVAAAIDRWAAAGASAAELAAMRAVTITVADLIGQSVGSSGAGFITLDSDGAGYGWFVDATPGDDSEFYQGAAFINGPAHGKIDLLTVLTHELGHQIGLDDTYATGDQSELMYGFVNPGERRGPDSDDAAAATGVAIGGSAHFAITPVSIGGLPGGKSVTVTYTSTVNGATDQQIPGYTNSASVSGGNFTTVTSNSEALVVDTLTLGGLIFQDADVNGAFDAGDSGIDGVALQLYADTNDDGAYDAGDTLITTTTTAGGGLYSFTALAPGDYLVRIDPAAFAGPLTGLGATVAGATDPDDNVDSDNNGVAVSGTIATRAITLAYNTEPTAGTGNDTNVTLDIGVFAPNAAPTASDVQGDSASFTEGVTPVLLDVGSDATISDTDSANFDGGSLTVAVTTNATTTEDVLGIATVGSVTTSAGTVSVGGTPIGTYSGGSGGTSLVVALNANATAATVGALLHALSYANSNQADPSTTTRGVTITLVDGDGTAGGGTDTLTVTTSVTVTAVDDAPTGGADTGSTTEDATTVITVLTNDDDVDGPPLSITEINGTPASIGVPITIGSGATVTLNANGTLTYDPNDMFNALTATGNPYGAQNTSATDSFTYTLDGGTPTSVTVTVNGVASADDRLGGSGGDDVIAGTPQADLFMLEQGGQEDVSGGGGNDAFYFGAALDAGDNVDGEGGDDVVGVQGDYSGGLTLGANNLIRIETLAIISGADTRFGDTAGNSYSYNLTVVDANVGAGAVLTVNANNLAVGENLTFDGTLEQDGSFFIYAGRGDDTLTGGQQNDAFFFGNGGRFSAADTVDGQGGVDNQLALRGDYSTQIVFAATTMTNIQTLALMSAQDIRFAGPADAFDYNVRLDDANVENGETLTVSGNRLRADEDAVVDGSAETDGAFRFIMGAGDDSLFGGAGDDHFYGRLGADTLTGGGGNDTFHYTATADSTGTSLDEILDFNAGDIIDLSAIDANTLVGGNNAFSFIGGAAFTTAGQLRATLAGGVWTVEGDTDGDGNADIVIAVTTLGGHALTVNDFGP